MGTRTVAVEDGSLHSYVGGWPEYVRVRDERRGRDRGKGGTGMGRPAVHMAARRGSATGAQGGAPTGCGACAGGRGSEWVPSPASSGGSRRGPSRRGRRRIGWAPAEGREGRRSGRGGDGGLKDELADPAAWATQYESAKSEARHTAARRAVEDAYARLETLID